MEEAAQLPEYDQEQFRLDDPPECDMIMKGGITSGIVYPYAVLEIATKYRFRSLGGTSAGAIAAAFAAAAEYARQNGRPEGFILLKRYCDELPERLLSLFQPDARLTPAVDAAREARARGGVRPFALGIVKRAAPLGVLGAVVLAGSSALLGASAYAVVLAILLGLLIGTAAGAYRVLRIKYVAPVMDALTSLPALNFGFCTGLTQPGAATPALTDWMYKALQHIAFGDPNHETPLTFGDLRGSDPGRHSVDLRVVTTSLSMRRPHTLPRLGVAAGFVPAEWERLFPEPVMRYLYAASQPWRREAGTWRFPQEDALPVVVAVRMSLSFPVLFTAVPLRIEDTELPSVVKSLGGKPYKRIRTVHFSDGGISSNFPIHMFDALLPRRPTFAFSLEELLWNPDEVKERVALPGTAREGMGVQITEIRDLKSFAWQIISSAKDWQDQLLSEISGQRERVARIYLTEREGGLNLDMSPETSRRLMYWGYQAGKKFTEGAFSFDEHRWRRLLVLYKHLDAALSQGDASWRGGFRTWYEGYLGQVRSYKRVTKGDREKIRQDLDRLFDVTEFFKNEDAIEDLDDKLPRKSGTLKVGPTY